MTKEELSESGCLLLPVVDEKNPSLVETGVEESANKLPYVELELVNPDEGLIFEEAGARTDFEDLIPEEKYDGKPVRLSELENKISSAESNLHECNFYEPVRRQINGVMKRMPDLKKIANPKTRDKCLWLSERANYALDYAEAYDDALNVMLTASGAISGEDRAEKLKKYCTPMVMSDNETISSAEKIKNQMILRAKLSALKTLKLNHKRKFISLNYIKKQSNGIIDAMGKEVYDYGNSTGDWEIIRTFQKLTGRNLNSAEKSAVEEDCVAETPKKTRWFGKVLRSAALIGLGVLGALGYQHYSAQKSKVPVPVAAERIERAESKVDYLDFDRFMSERMPKRVYKSLSLEDVASEENENRSYSELKLW